MTKVKILSVRPASNKHAIFVSAGERETFASYALRHLTDTFDVLVFSYARGDATKSSAWQGATVLAAGSGTKFNALQSLFHQYPDALTNYQTIWVCDDDLILENGDYRSLPMVALAVGASVLSPAHSIRGKISHPIMLPQLGRHFFRFTNFVEMTAPLFQTAALIQFLQSYDGSLRGYADDCWFLCTLNADETAVAGVVDLVSIINPRDAQKPGGYGEAELLGNRAFLKMAWAAAKEKYGLREWRHETKRYIAFDDPVLADLGVPTSALKRKLKEDARTVISILNYGIRFYGLRKRIARQLERIWFNSSRGQ